MGNVLVLSLLLITEYYRPNNVLKIDVYASGEGLLPGEDSVET